jgi:hypothetical protein
MAAGDFCGTCEAHIHFPMHGVDGAAADRIVGVVLQHDPPGEIEAVDVGLASSCAEPGGQRLEISRQQPIVGEVGALLRHPTGCAAFE